MEVGVTESSSPRSLDDSPASAFTRRLAYFEAGAEKEKIRISRALHDDLGGLLVAAAMDTAWAEQHLSDNPAVHERLKRIRVGLAGAIDLKRKLLEEIRPTLLENFGLVAALRWYHEHNCQSARLACTSEYPDEELDFSAPASNVLFRVVEEALALARRQPSAQSAHLRINTATGELCVQVSHDGDVLDERQRDEADEVSIWIIEQRLSALGGQVSVSHPATGGMLLEARVPLGRVVKPAA
jgi:signal transduction histidine kinase